MTTQPRMNASLRMWLTADVTTSPWQARLQRAYFGWRRMCGNRLTLFGLAVLLFLAIIAALAPLISPEGYDA
jgi:peptide/nickel transport system permease protein